MEVIFTINRERLAWMGFTIKNYMTGKLSITMKNFFFVPSTMKNMTLIKKKTLFEWLSILCEAI